MPGKIFISFLGTNDYKEVAYVKEGHKAIFTKYVQIATFKICCSDYGEGDRVFIFTTPSAKKANWVDNGHIDRATNIPKGSKGLYQCFRDLGLDLNPIEIPEGKSEQQIWEIFQKVYACIEEGDEITFDITHAFRSIPMLTMVLINYAKLLKNIKLKGIYYGAFEVEDEQKPIWDLTAFSQLQDWTNAANGFVNYGNAKAVKNLAQQTVLPILRNQHHQHVSIARELDKLAKNIESVSDHILTNRGAEIVEARVFDRLFANLENLSDDDFIPPFQPILEKVKDKISIFNRHCNIHNGFAAVQWCLDHDLIQQGYTLLQECIISWIAELAGLDMKNKEHRDQVAGAIFTINHKIHEDYEKYQSVIKVLPPELASVYDSLSNDRNDINHAGFSRNKTPENLRKVLINTFTKVISIIYPTHNN
jgi:CRISPR-associated DxTHG motif protein